MCARSQLHPQQDAVVARATAARGMGLAERQILTRVEIPLGLGVIIGGTRSAAVTVIATATLGAIFGFGGLGLAGHAWSVYGQRSITEADIETTIAAVRAVLSDTSPRPPAPDPIGATA